MDIQVRIGTFQFLTTPRRKSSSPFSRSSSPLKPLCSKREEPQQNGDKFSTDWDKAWANIKKQN
ncbi:hypothetical protein, partial [Staphylococcus aureus]|uniref:hypothetical protein n=1 Tax=Staphylococcus aureus TaxID=1280 RepID=UPI0038B3EFEB